MEDEDVHMNYPDPSATAVGPYHGPYQSLDVSGTSYDNFNPSLYWQSGPQPPVHEGFIPRSDDLADDDDLEEDPRALFARFNLDSILNPFGNISEVGNGELEDGIDERMDFDEDMLQAELQIPLPEVNDQEVDPDFDGSENEDDSEDDISINSDLFADIVEEQTGSRGRGGKRGRGGRGRGRGRGRGWKWAIKGTEHDENANKEKRKPGRPKGSKSQIPRGEGRRRGGGGVRFADPGAEYKNLQKKATDTFLAGDYEAAANYAREAVHANPEVFAAHSLLAEILMAQGDEQDALTVLIAGAHTKRDRDLWHHCAERTLDLAGDNRPHAALDSAIYCYSWAIRLDQKDLEARRAKLNLLLEDYNEHGTTNAPGRARQECKMILADRPDELPVVNTLGELALLSKNTQDMAAAKPFFEKAIQSYVDGTTLGEASEQWSYVNNYLDLVEKVDGPAEAIAKLKSVSRWLLGRSAETFWDDNIEDDREFDDEDEPRRTRVENFITQGSVDKAQYGEGLPLDLRIKLGDYRIALGPEHHPEALRHYETLLPFAAEVVDYADLFKDVGVNLHSKKEYGAAIKYFEPLQDVPDYQDTDYYMALADCYNDVNRLVDAEDCYKVIITNNEDDWEARVLLAKMFEEQGRRQEALPLIERVIALGRTDALKQRNVHFAQPPRMRPPTKAQRKSQADLPAFRSIAPKETVMPVESAPLIDTPPDGGVQMDDSLPTPVQSPEREQRARPTTKRTLASKPATQKKRTGRKYGLTAVPNANAEKLRKAAEKMQNMRDKGQRIKTNWEILQSCREDIDKGDEDAQRMWMQSANSMLDDFRSMRVFYPGKDKHLKFAGYGRHNRLLDEMEAMRDRLQEEDDDASAQPVSNQREGVPDDFHDISFQQWLDIFCEYALFLAREDNREKCYDVLQAAYIANVFYHWPDACKQVHTTWLASALSLDDEQTITTVCRWFMSHDPHSYGPYQLFNAISCLCASNKLNWFNAGPTQKYLLRAIKAQDFHLLTADQRKKYVFTGQEKSTYTRHGQRKPNWMGMEELNTSILTLYGHIMAAASTWPSALNYYFRALSLDPENVTLNLCIGLAYIQNAMKRQSDNRHWGIMQGFAFLNRYYKIRTTGSLNSGRKNDNNVPSEDRQVHDDDGLSKEDGKIPALHKQEAEYNVARAWHLLGLTHHAIRGYEKCLLLADVIRVERERAQSKKKKNVATTDEDAVMADVGADHGAEGKEDEDGDDNDDDDDDDNDDAEERIDAEEFTQEAALALCQIYAMADNEGAARRVAERYLVI